LVEDRAREVGIFQEAQATMAEAREGRPSRRHELETLAMQRRLRALALVETRDCKSLETMLLKEGS
jgi:hypothetical protein